MLIGYARVSLQEQDLTLQQDALKKEGCEKIFVDRVTGVKKSRLGLDRAMEALRKDDTLVVWRLDRLGRSLKHLIEIVGNLEEKGIGFKSIQEEINTMTSGGKLVFHIFGALAEFERNLIRERTCAGLASARARGRMGGRPRALNYHKKKLAIKLYKERVHTVNHICKIMGISKMTLYRYIDEEKEKE